MSALRTAPALTQGCVTAGGRPSSPGVAAVVEQFEVVRMGVGQEGGEQGDRAVHVVTHSLCLKGWVGIAAVVMGCTGMEGPCVHGGVLRRGRGGNREVIRQLTAEKVLKSLSRSRG